MPVEEPTEEEVRQAQLEQEMKKWQVLGLDPANWNPREGILGVVLRLDVMTEILVEAGILNMDDCDKRIQIKALERLREIRKDLEPMIAEAKLNAIRNGDLRKH